MSNRKKLFSDASCSSMTPRHHCMLASQREIQRRRWTTAWYTHTVFWASPKRRHSTELTSPDQYATSSWMDGATLQIHSTKGKGMVVCTFTKPALGNSRSRWPALLGFGAPWPEESKRKRDRERPRGPSHSRSNTWHSSVPSRQIRVNRVAGLSVEESGSFAF